jgi:hypothetical protein
VEVEKFKFPSRGFHIVADKVGEADYFLEKLKSVRLNYAEFSYILSAFTSAVRSITFSLQAVMSKYPKFQTWYELEQTELKSNSLAKYFVNLRNHLQKIGHTPVEHSGSLVSGEFEEYSYFIEVEGLEKAPEGEVTRLSEEYFIAILKVIERCYREFAVYADPRALFTEQGLSVIGWEIEDIEEAVGLPRGWTDIPYDSEDKNIQRLKLLRRDFGGDEMMEQYFSKYDIPSSVAE